MPDLHSWIILDGVSIADGGLIDWDFPEYKFTKDLLDLTNTPAYDPFDIKKQIECAAYMKSQVDKRKMIQGDTFDKWLDEFYKKPVKGMCFYNCLAYKKHNPTCKMVFGKFGWLKKNGEPYYEYGDSDKVEYKQDINEMVSRMENKMKGMTKGQKKKFMKKALAF